MNMNKNIDDIKFTTKIINATDKQKDFIYDLLDQLDDLGINKYDNINVDSLSKYDAKELIEKLLYEVESNDFSFESCYEDNIY